MIISPYLIYLVLTIQIDFTIVQAQMFLRNALGENIRKNAFCVWTSSDSPFSDQTHWGAGCRIITCLHHYVRIGEDSLWNQSCGQGKSLGERYVMDGFSVFPLSRLIHKANQIKGRNYQGILNASGIVAEFWRRIWPTPIARIAQGTIKQWKNSSPQAFSGAS